MAWNYFFKSTSISELCEDVPFQIVAIWRLFLNLIFVFISFSGFDGIFYSVSSFLFLHFCEIISDEHRVNPIATGW